MVRYIHTYMRRRLSLVVACAVCAACVLLMYASIYCIWTRSCVPPPVVSRSWKAQNLAHHTQQCTVTRHTQRLEPEVLRSLAFLALKFDRTHCWTTALHMADTYARGAWPLFAPHPAVAASLYRFINEHSDDVDVAHLSEAKLRDVFRNPIGTDDVQGHQLPTQYAKQVLQTHVPRRSVTPQPQRPARPTPQRPYQRPYQRPPRPLPEHPVLTDPTEQPELPVPTTIHSDSQNVHDHGVVASLRANIRALKTEINIDDDSDVRPAIQEAIDAVTDVTPEQRAHADMVLSKLGSQKVGSVGVSEQEVAALVWAKIQSMDSDMRGKCTEILAKQLASGVEHGSVVCSTGKVARLLGTLDGIPGSDDHVASKPLWAVQQELMALASSRRDRGDSADQFTQEALDTYVRDLGMSPETLGPLIEACASGF